MPALKHIHVYQRLQRNKKYYRCLDSICTHKMHKEDLVGKRARCICGNEFNLTPEDLKRARPRCLECSNTVKSRLVKKMQGELTAELESVFSKADGADEVSGPLKTSVLDVLKEELKGV